MDIKQKQKLKRFIRELSLIRGRHTELVSVYIPAGYDIHKIINHLDQEKGTASNIKDAKTRNHVISSLEKTIRHLRLFKQTPPNGFAIFAGNASQKESQTDIKVWSVEPPEPLNLRLYRCDQTFLLEPLKQFIETRDMYGLIVMDRREATIGVLRGSTIKALARKTSGVPGKIRAGGQSAARYERLREGAAKDFYKRISEIVNKEFLGKKQIKGILIGGPGHTKEEFKEYLNTEIKNKIIGIKDLTYTDESGLHDLVSLSQDALAKEQITHERELLEKFFALLAKSPEKVAYGEAEVKKALEYGAADTLLISENLSDQKIEEFEKYAEKTRTILEIISLETREGQQLKDLGGIAAILRFAIS